MARGDAHDHQVRVLAEIGAKVVANLDTESLLRQIVEEARAITGARYGALGVLGPGRDRLERFITSGVDEQTKAAIGALPSGHGVLGLLIDEPHPLRLPRVADHPASYGFPPGHPPMNSFLGVPIMVGGEAYGNLYLTEKRDGLFDEADEEAIVALAGWAAIAIANARSVDEGRLRAAMAASDYERARWARELHDETLQGLGALRLLLSAARRAEDLETMRAAIGEAIEQVALETTSLRFLISELRPAALDSMGLEAALESLAAHSAATSDFALECEINFAPGAAEGFGAELETAVYRVAQEALGNATRHSGADSVKLVIRADDEAVELAVTDDGDGFDPAAAHSGYGLAGMRERVLLARGSFDLTSSAAGTRIEVRIPTGDQAESSKPWANA